MDVLTSEIEYALVQTRGDPRAAGQLLLEVMTGPKFPLGISTRQTREHQRELAIHQEEETKVPTNRLQRLVGTAMSRRIMRQGEAAEFAERFSPNTQAFQVVMASVTLDAFVNLAEEAQLSDDVAYTLYKNNVLGKGLDRYPHFFPLATHIYGKHTDRIIEFGTIRSIVQANSEIHWSFKFYDEWVILDAEAIVLLNMGPGTQKDAEFILHANLERDIAPMLSEMNLARNLDELQWEPGAGFVTVQTEVGGTEGVVVKPGENFGDAVERCLVPIDLFTYLDTVTHVRCVLFQYAWHYPQSAFDDAANFAMRLEEIGDVQAARRRVVTWCLASELSANAAMALTGFSTWDDLKSFVMEELPRVAFDYLGNTELWYKYELEYEHWDDDEKKNFPEAAYNEIRPKALEIIASIKNIPLNDIEDEPALDLWISEARWLFDEDYVQNQDFKQYVDWYAFYSLPISDKKKTLAVQYYQTYYPQMRDYHMFIPKYLDYRAELAESLEPPPISERPKPLTREEYVKYLAEQGVFD